MVTRVSYQVEVRIKDFEMKLSGVSFTEVLLQLNIRNYAQLKRWMRRYENGEIHSFEQPIGKQDSYGKGPDFRVRFNELIDFRFT